MDESRSKRVKNVPSRKNIPSRRGTSHDGGVQVDWSFQSNSPAMISNNSRNLRSLDREKAVAAHRVDLNNIFLPPQRSSLKVKKKASPSLLIERSSFPYDSTIIPQERKIGSPPIRHRSPASAKVSPYQTPQERSISRSNSRAKETSHREPTDKVLNVSHSSQTSHKPKYRGSSNPRPPLNESYHSTSRNNDSSYKRESRADLDSTMLPDSAKMNYLKQSWLSNDHSSELALASLLNKKPPSSTGKREQQRIYREKKMSYMSNLNDSSFQSKMGDSHLKLKDASKYLDLKDLRIGPSLSRDLQKLGLIVRQEALTQKLRPDKSQELKANSQFQAPMYAANFAAQGQENKERHQNPNEILEEQRPIGTEEYYEEFFSTHKMTFDFERTRVSQRTGKKKDYYTPEPTPSNANAGLKNYFSNREAPMTLSYRPSEEKVMRVRYVD